MIKSVFMSIPIYYLTLFKLPEKVKKIMESYLKAFLWAGAEGIKKFPLVAWNKTQLKKIEGGLGIRDLKKVNTALLGKLGWELLNKGRATGAKIMRNKYIRNGINFMSENIPSEGSNIWKAVKSTRDMLNKGLRWRIGDGERVRFWEDVWLLSHPL